MPFVLGRNDMICVCIVFDDDSMYVSSRYTHKYILCFVEMQMIIGSLADWARV